MQSGSVEASDGAAPFSSAMQSPVFVVYLDLDTDNFLTKAKVPARRLTGTPRHLPPREVARVRPSQRARRTEVAIKPSKYIPSLGRLLQSASLLQARAALAFSKKKKKKKKERASSDSLILRDL